MLPVTDPAAIACQFALPGEVLSVIEYGSGNVNDTYLVRTTGGRGVSDFILQRLNPAVFPEPERIMHNLRVLDDHVRPKLPTNPSRRWELPTIISARNGDDYYRDDSGVCWRVQSFVAGAESFPAIVSVSQAEEAGRGLGFFHGLIHDLPVHLLHDTLPGFHVTPGYLDRYTMLDAAPPRPDSSPESFFCSRFIDERKTSAGVLEAALAEGKLRPCPIHGDPKPANILFARDTGRAVSLIDLDTVKPGLLHYDIGDCLRSCCNPAGEEAGPAEISFNLDYCKAILRGYLPQVAPFFSSFDYQYIYDAVRLIAFELGLRFFSDHLAGDVYFKIRRPGQNLHRATVQFALCQSIEAQEAEIRAIVRGLQKS
ncbi:MAG: aminoglycoside phosphotransferase family protein [Proteobacteria bacterium]|nr:aminoglycoside phosphotransferase family protein [Pseudomonadota bacterium]